MLLAGLTESSSGWPSFLLAALGSAAVAVLAYFVSRKLGLARRLLPAGTVAPPPFDRVRQLAACADYGTDYGFGALPDFPACAQDPVLARAARLFVEHTHPDDLSAVLDADLQEWINERVKSGLLIRKVQMVLPVVGVLGLFIGLVGALAIANGWFPRGLASAGLVLAATLLGILATAFGSAHGYPGAVVDPACVLDRQIIIAAMIALRRGKGSREIEAHLIDFLPAADRAHAVQARAA